MSDIVDIGIKELVLSFAILIIPVSVLLIYKVKLVKGLLIGALRMGIQLSLVAVYLEWVFDKNNAWINSLWVFIMIMVGVFTTLKRISLSWKTFALPLFIAGLTSVTIIDTFFLGFIIKLDYIFDVRYLIPITGMILGNSMNHNIVGLTAFFKGLNEKTDLYYFLLTNTGSAKLALRPFFGEAFKRALNPMVANMSVIGLISLPGMMTGQILGGSSPVVAIKYQIMIMLAIFSGCSLTLFLSIFLSKRKIIGKFENIRFEKIGS